MKTQNPLKYLPLSFFTDKLNNNEPFSLIRVGDGEFHILYKTRPTVAYGIECTDRLQARFEYVMTHQYPNLYFGMQRNLPHQIEKLLEDHPLLDWVDSEIFTDELIAGNLKPFIDALRNKTVTIVGPEFLKFVPIKYKHFISTPEIGALDLHEELKESIRACTSDVYIYCCGPEAKMLISDLHGDVPGFHIDLGHILEVAVGKRERTYLEKLPQEIIDKNFAW